MRHPFEADARSCRYVVGIDLGTTNTAVAYVDLADEKAGGARRTIRFFEIPQLTAPGEVAHRPGLPSFLYLPGAHELPPGSTALPWDARRSYVVGEMAREQGARVPGRLVASAKSWLCHEGVDRTAPVLPWGAPDEVPRVSPVEASRRYLQHIREAWDARLADGRPEAAFDRQLVILTVPASFDEVARELTVDAARRAGIPHVVLLEEPLAAFYAWVADHEHAWQEQMQAGQLILVCDVGGGTTDFSVVGIREDEDGLRFDRLAVGDHLMLGGDNMDYALGRHLETRMAGGPGRLDAQRWHQLVHGCRRAKERLLGAPETADEAEVVTVAGTGSRLIAGTLQESLTRHDVQQLLLDGFFPEVALDEPPAERPRKGLTEMGLPYVHEPAVTRHLAAFWRRFRPYLQEETGRTAVYPDYVLFNGGVLTPPSLRGRLMHILGTWFAPTDEAGRLPLELHNPRLDLAVAMGAAYYGLVRLGEGIRIGSGSPRAYYVGVKTEREPAEETHTAVCLVPRGADEGFTGRLEPIEFEALTNQPVTFYLFSSTTRSGDRPGDVVQLAPDEVVALPPIRSVLQFGKKGIARRIPIQLAVRLTEIGTLEVWCQSRHTEHRWQLQFDVRREAEPEAEGPVLEETLDPAWIEAAGTRIRDLLEQAETPRPEHVWHQLEASLHLQRTAWPVPVLRKLADTLLAVPRDGSPRREALWFDLLGYCLRPGFGDPVDDWRMQQAWKIHLEGLHFPEHVSCRTAWWVFWRRVAGGLPAEKQTQMYHEVRPYLQLKVLTKKRHRIYPRRMDAREQGEAWMALASFERLPADIKVTLGRLLLQKMKQNRLKDAELWALSRLGIRLPTYGPLECLVPPEEVAAWVKAVLTSYPPRKESVGYALVHLTRYTGDRNRDVPEETRQQVHRWLRKLPDETPFRDLLANPESPFSQEAQDWLQVDPLPATARAELDPHGIAYTVSDRQPAPE